MLGLQHNPDGTPKDTTRNIHVTGEFVVNLVDEAIAEAMNLTSIDFPPGESEPVVAGLGLAVSTLVKPPRLADAPAAFECRRTVALAFGPQRELLIGEVLGVYVREGIVDPATLNVDFAALRPVGRLCGNAYARHATCSSSSASPTPSGAPNAANPRLRADSANTAIPVDTRAIACDDPPQ